MTICVMLRLYVRGFMIKSLGVDDYVIIFSMVRITASYAFTRTDAPVSGLRNLICWLMYRANKMGPRLAHCATATSQSRSVLRDQLCWPAAIHGGHYRLQGGLMLCLPSHHRRKDQRRPVSISRLDLVHDGLCCLVASRRHSGITLSVQPSAQVLAASHARKVSRQCHHGKCFSPTAQYQRLTTSDQFYVLAANTILCDVIIILLPIPLLLRIKINNRKKIGLICVFTLGLFTTVCSIMRMVQIEIIAKNGNSTNLVLWGTVELNVGVSQSPQTMFTCSGLPCPMQIFLTCLPTLTPLVTWFANKSRKGTYEYTYGQNATAASGAIKLGSVDKQQVPVGITSKISHASRNDSEETILPMHGHDDMTILKTTTVDIKRYSQC